MSDRQFARALAHLPYGSYTGHLFRQQSPQYLPLSGEGARIRGGRWNPPESFPVLYTAPSIATCIAELERHAQQQKLDVSDLMPRVVMDYEVVLNRLVDLTDPSIRDAIGVSTAVLADDDLRICQAIGAMAHHLGFEGIVSPSATGVGDSAAIFVNRLALGSEITVSESRLHIEREVT